MEKEIKGMIQGLPKISVIIPVYNGQNYLREAINSVLYQTYKNYEMIVVDDGSTDRTWEIIESYGSCLQGIRKENGGVGSALNWGIQKAMGEYIAWLSHDDLFLPTKLERQVSFLLKFPQFKACYTDYYIIDDHGRIVAEVDTPWYPREQAIRALFGRSYVHGSTIIIERTCFDRVGYFSERWRYTQDTEMWLRLLRQFEIGRVPEKLVKGRVHLNQGSRNVDIHIAEAQAMYQQVFEKLGVAGVFPALAAYANEPKVIAKTFMWLGDVMAIYRGWHAFADEQYARAISLYPSWRNIARLKRIVNQIGCILRLNIRILRHIFKPVLKGGLNSEENLRA
jgi:glycosyltransferase involved in cell wall biosynthesis